MEKATVLVVDDDPLNIQLLGQALSQHYKVKTAINGEVALNVASAEPKPDLILLDVQMPLLSGFEVLIQLRSQDATKDIPVIFITGNDAVEDEAKGLELGAMDYITKPFNVPVVLARVRNQIILKRKNDLLEQLVSIDGLTEIPNRRNFEEVFAQEWRRCLRNQTPLTMIMIDIDFFKQYNDNYGHTAGDEVLRKVAQTLDAQLKRGADFVARFGGEEFVVVLPETDFPASLKFAESLRSAVEQLAIKHEYSEAAKVVTISLGQSTIIPTKQLSAIELQESADKMLYQAKELGRNQTSAVDTLSS
ncbi:diguanylate cyclase [Marinifaba aquimaris]|uniref:diguanylate cyclase n=1 Tax=Marinifaba aquimaris TaxID=2741323 RepID=UPI001C2CFA89|nr:diguanylate cyclase [Marinifaba aquimaris]